MIIKLAERILKTKFGDFTEQIYYDGQKESIALVRGNIDTGEPVLCRIHSSCICAHVFNSIECDCREQMEMAQAWIEEEGRGVIIWLDQEGRANGHLALVASKKLMLEEELSQTQAYVALGYPADNRDYRAAAEILRALNISSVILITNSPDKFSSLSDLGINITSVRPVFLNLLEHPSLRRSYTDKIGRGHYITVLDEKESVETNKAS